MRRLRNGHVTNVAIDDLTRLVEACGFTLDRVAGSHHIYVHDRSPRNLNLQDVRGQAKPYQVRQFLRLVDAYDLVPEDLS